MLAAQGILDTAVLTAGGACLVRWFAKKLERRELENQPVRQRLVLRTASSVPLHIEEQPKVSPKPEREVVAVEDDEQPFEWLSRKPELPQETSVDPVLPASRDHDRLQETPEEPLLRMEESLSSDPIDGMLIEDGEAACVCRCGLVYRAESVAWLHLHLGGRCVHCESSLAQAPVELPRSSVGAPEEESGEQALVTVYA